MLFQRFSMLCLQICKFCCKHFTIEAGSKFSSQQGLRSMTRSKKTGSRNLRMVLSILHVYRHK